MRLIAQRVSLGAHMVNDYAHVDRGGVEPTLTGCLRFKRRVVRGSARHTRRLTCSSVSLAAVRTSDSPWRVWGPRARSWARRLSLSLCVQKMTRGCRGTGLQLLCVRAAIVPGFWRCRTRRATLRHRVWLGASWVRVRVEEGFWESGTCRRRRSCARGGGMCEREIKRVLELPGEVGEKRRRGVGSGEGGGGSKRTG